MSSEKAKNAGFGCLVLLGLVALIGYCSTPSAEETAKQTAASAEEKRKGFHCLSKWDGSHLGLVDQVKAGLRDPDSFEHDATRITPADEQGRHTLMMTYRARNGFGGMNVEVARAKVDRETCGLSEVSTADED